MSAAAKTKKPSARKKRQKVVGGLLHAPAIRKRTPEPPKEPAGRGGAKPGVLYPKAAEKVGERKALALLHLRRTNGNVAVACEKAGISRMTHYRWLKQDAEYAMAVEDLAEGVVDTMEALFIDTTIKEKDLRSLRWFLERRGKGRGYGKPSVLPLLDGDGGSGGGVRNVIGQQINVQVVRGDVPGDAVVRALKDIAESSPALIKALVEKADAARALEGGKDAPSADDGDDDDDDDDEAQGFVEVVDAEYVESAEVEA